MNIVYTFDDGYSAIAAVSICSLLTNNNKTEELRIYIVDCGISEENRTAIENLVSSFGRNTVFVGALDLDHRIPMRLHTGYWSTVCYVRLFFAEMFPDLDKIMHIDCDTIIRGSLEEAYKTDMEDYYCAACYDCVAASKRKLGLPNYKPYLSNGFIVFDLEKMRRDDIVERFVQYIVEKKGELPHLDQDVLSEVLGENTQILHPKYNLMSITTAYGPDSVAFFDDDPYYSKMELKEAVANPAIVHFVGNRFMNRPWEQPCYHPYNNEWLDYYKETVKIDNIFEMDIISQRSLIRRLAAIIWRMGFELPPIRKLELKFDRMYYINKGRK